MELEDLIKFKEGDLIKFKKNLDRYNHCYKYRGKTGMIAKIIRLLDSVDFYYLIALHQSCHVVYTSACWIELDDEKVLKERVEEVKKRLT